MTNLEIKSFDINRYLNAMHFEITKMYCVLYLYILDYCLVTHRREAIA